LDVRALFHSPIGWNGVSLKKEQIFCTLAGWGLTLKNNLINLLGKVAICTDHTSCIGLMPCCLVIKFPLAILQYVLVNCSWRKNGGILTPPNWYSDGFDAYPRYFLQTIALQAMVFALARRTLVHKIPKLEVFYHEP